MRDQELHVTVEFTRDQDQGNIDIYRNFWNFCLFSCMSQISQRALSATINAQEEKASVKDSVVIGASPDLPAA